MTFPVRPVPYRLRFGLIALALILLLGLLFAVLPPDGLEGSNWAQFAGRFHLLTVHFPIALILIVPILEIAGRHRSVPYLRTSVDFVLGLALVSSLAAATLGWLLARNGGYSGRLVTQHMWGGVGVAAACWVCWMVRGYNREAMYALALLGTVGLVSWTGYRGGQLSQGENHLTEHMPVGMKKLIGLPVTAAVVPRSNPAFFYGAHVEPIFVDHCYQCHSAEEQKGRLRLDTYESLMHGGKHGVVIKAGDVKGSELFHRVTLSPSDDDAMPPQGKKPLSANEVKLLELWIANGASPTLAADGIQGAPTTIEPVAAEVTFAEIDPAAVAQSRASLAGAVAEAQKRFPDVLNYESRGSAGLVIDASALGPRFGDDDLAAMKPLSQQTVVVDLSNTLVSDRSAALLAGLKKARVLRLTNTKITDATVSELGGLGQLESLDLYGTVVTPACLETVQHLPRLRHLYVGATRIPVDFAAPAALQGKMVF